MTRIRPPGRHGSTRGCGAAPGSGMDDRFHDECGLIGIHGRGDVPDLLYYGLYAHQHRGQEGCGMVLHNGEKTRLLNGLGPVSEVFTEEARRRHDGYLGIAHNRYATTGRATRLRNVQPILVDYHGGKLAIAHNGNLTNVANLRARMEGEGSIFQTTTDSEMVLHLIARSRRETLAERAEEALRQVEGAITCLIMDEHTLIGYRDPFGFRPLSLGVLDGMNVLASETCAFDIVGASVVRDVEPGEMVVLTREGMVTRRVFPDRPRAQCLFELVYFSRPDSVVFGEAVNDVRRRQGRLLARRQPVEADIVIAIPDSSNSAAQGFAEEAGLPLELGLIRNHYVGRTFIQAGADNRVDAVRAKFNSVEQILRGKRVVAVDDSIVRGTTSRQLVGLIQRAGATEVHFRVASPPITDPCHYGIDTPTRGELIANRGDVEAIRRFIGATSLGYLAIEDLEESVRAPRDYCYACWTGRYPTAVPGTGTSVPFDRD
jgi:amidophosphoribosyltransferase